MIYPYEYGIYEDRTLYCVYCGADDSTTHEPWCLILSPAEEPCQTPNTQAA